MEQLNEIRLRGRVGSIKVSEVSGKKLVRFTLRTEEMYNGNGCIVCECTWHNIVAWDNGKMPNFEDIKKESGVYVVGRLRNQKYTASDGTDRYSCEVVAREMEIVA